MQDMLELDQFLDDYHQPHLVAQSPDGPLPRAAHDSPSRPPHMLPHSQYDSDDSVTYAPGPWHSPALRGGPGAVPEVWHSGAIGSAARRAARALRGGAADGPDGVLTDRDAAVLSFTSHTAHPHAGPSAQALPSLSPLSPTSTAAFAPRNPAYRLRPAAGPAPARGLGGARPGLDGPPSPASLGTSRGSVSQHTALLEDLLGSQDEDGPPLPYGHPRGVHVW